MNGKKTPGRIPALLLVCLACCALIYATGRLTDERIRYNQAQRQLAVLDTVISSAYDNNPLADYIDIDAATDAGIATRLRAYRLKKDGVISGLVIQPLAARGYNGVIELIVGLDTAGNIMGVKVLRHSETAGIGDQIHQDNSDWLGRFNGLSLANTPAERWRIRPEGGRIDHISGATTSTRAVTRALKRLLQYYQYNRPQLLGQ